MDQNVVVMRFPGHHLDPTAQEFRPTYHPAQLQPQNHPPYAFHHPQPELFFPPPEPPVIPYVTHFSPPYYPPSLPPSATAPTRAVFLSAVPPEVSESCVRRELEVFGDVRAVQMERVREGIVTVHFYDLRAAHAALDAVREQHMQHQNRLRIHYNTFNVNNNNSFHVVGPPLPPPGPGLVSGRAVWAQFTIPVTNAFPDGHNQGTLVVFNLDPNVSAQALRDIFKVFGAVKELRETPMKRQQRFIEFYDVRDAAKALAEMNCKEINGRGVMIEYSRPGGHNNKKLRNQYHHQNNNNHEFAPNYNHHHYAKPLPPSPPPPPPPPPQQAQSRGLPFRNRRTSPRQHQVRRRRCSPSSEESIEAVMSGLTLRPSRGDVNVRRTNVGEERKGGMKGNGNGSGNCTSSNSGSTKQQQKVRPWKGRQKNFDPRFLIKEDAIIEEGACKDTRTTVMIKNIPNKYSQKLLLNMLDNHCIHCNEQIAASGAADSQPLSSYDFIYLPIDFNNKCNVGYGFVNMTSPEATLRLYKAFHHQHWEVFNSRKICEVTYARVQGLESLKEHFKNSKFACENDEYLPVVFTPPRNGRHLTTPLPIVFSTTLTPSTLHHDNNADLDGGDLTSQTSTITVPSSSEDFDDHQGHNSSNIDFNASWSNNIIMEGGNHDHDDSSRSSSDGGGDVINDDDDMGDQHCNSRSVGVTAQDY